MLLEFFTIHAFGFLFSSLEKRSGIFFKIVKTLVIGTLIGSVYFWVIQILSSWVDASWLTIFFLIFCLKRIWAFIFNKILQTDCEKITFKSLWITQIACFTGLMLLTSDLPVPAFGIKPELIAQTKSPNSGGQWVDSPQTLVAFGFLYFVAIGLASSINIKNNSI